MVLEAHLQQAVLLKKVAAEKHIHKYIIIVHTCIYTRVIHVHIYIYMYISSDIHAYPDGLAHLRNRLCTSGATPLAASYWSPDPGDVKKYAKSGFRTNFDFSP